MAERHEDQSPGTGEQVKAVREDLAPSKLNARLEEVIDERPKTRHLLDFSIVGKALLAAVVVALVLWILLSAQIAAFALVIVFVAGWLIGAQVSYDRRRGTRDVREDDGDEAGDDGAEEEDAPPRQAESRKPDADSDEYAADRGEAEAEQEQEGKGARNGTDPQREQHAER